MTRLTKHQRAYQAGCRVCHGNRATWTGPNAQALAARHHDRTGHQTWCEIAMSITYGAAVRDDRQTDLEELLAAR